jgi:putative endonuclease
MFYTYVLQSSTTSKTYIGQTNNLEDRLTRHNASRNDYTRNRGPRELIFYREFNKRAEAIELEKKLKSFKNKNYLLNWIKIQQLTASR